MHLIILFLSLLASLVFAGNYDYGDVIYKSLLFYEAQRSGKLPPSNRVGWRKDSMLEDRDGNIDLTGGYFDGKNCNYYLRTARYS
jgi:endoglucanase